MILLGESGSGKTSLFHRIIYDSFDKNQEPNAPLNTPSKDRTMDPEPSLGSNYKNRIKEVQLSGKNRVNVRVDIAYNFRIAF